MKSARTHLRTTQLPLSLALATTMAVATLAPAAWAQSGKSPISASPAPSSAVATELPPAGVNPMTGRPLSEEELNRQLNKSKLMTQLGQEHVKQAQNAADLALANLRAETEKNRARAEALAQLSASGASPGSAKSSGVTVIKPLQVLAPSHPATYANSTGTTSNTAQMHTQLQPPPSAPKAMPSGTLQIGQETLDLATGASAPSPAMVQWVDSQTRQVARAGAPLQPINVQPATGMLGIPAIPGIMPTASPGQAQ